MLAIPVSLGQVGHMMTGMADTAMVGQLGKTQLAGTAFATNVFMFLFILGIGLSIGITTLVGQAYGSGNKLKCRSLLQQGLLFYVSVGAILTLLNLALIPLFPYMGQEADVVQVASPFYVFISISVLPVMAFSGLKQFLEGMGKTVPPMVISLLGNLLNVGLNYVLIFGAFGIEPMGVNGAAIATLIARVMMFVGLAGYMYWDTELRYYFTDFGKFKIDWPTLTELGKVGLPIGLQFFMEVATFALGAIMMGWLGKVPQSAHQIAITLAATTFLAASGIGTAATIMLSNLHGQKQYLQLRKAGYAAYRLVLLFMLFTAIGFAAFKDILPTYFINEGDYEVAIIASGLLVVAALFQLSDGLQMVGISCLRGMGDVEVPMWLALVCYWIIALPSSYIFAFTLDLGPPGIWYGYLTGLTLAGIVFFVRFNTLTKRLLKSA